MIANESQENTIQPGLLTKKRVTGPIFKHQVVFNAQKLKVQSKKKEIIFNCSLIKNSQEYDGSDIKKFQNVMKSTKFVNSLEMDVSKDPFDKRKDYISLNENLKKLPTLQNFTFKHFGMKSPDQGLEAFQKRIKNLVNLQKYKLEINTFGSISTVVSNRISKSLQTLPLLKTFLLNTPLDFYAKKVALQKFIKSFRYPSLQHLSLDFTKNGLQDEELKDLADQFASILSLRHLHLDLSINEKITDQGLRILGETLQKLTNLKDLNLKFERCPLITDEGFRMMNQNLMKHPTLENLSLDLPTNFKVINGGFYDFDEIQKNLKTFKLNLEYCKIKGETFNNLGKLCKQMSSLKRLSLKLPRAQNLDDQDMLKFGEGLKELVYLEDLSLELREIPGMNDQRVKNLFAHLDKLHSLKSLSLNLSLCQGVTNETVHYVIEQLKPIFCFKSLHLNFNGCPINFEDPNIGKALKQMNSLQKIKLDLNNAGISDKGVLNLSQSFDKLKSLKSLSLNLNFCEKVTQKSLKSLGTGLCHSPSLEMVHLDFIEIYLKGSEGINALSSGLKEISSLKSLDLILESCGEFGDAELEILGKNLRRFQNLEAISLALSANENISVDGLLRLAQDLKKITSLRSVSLKLANLEIYDQDIISIQEQLESFYFKDGLKISLENE